MTERRQAERRQGWQGVPLLDVVLGTVLRVGREAKTDVELAELLLPELLVVLARPLSPRRLAERLRAELPTLDRWQP